MKTKWNVKLELGKMSVDQKVTKALTVVEKMTGNAHFPSPDPSLVDLYNRAQLLKTKQTAAEGGDHTKVAEMHEVESQLEIMLNNEAAYVAKVANADFENGESIIKSAGMEPKKERVTPVKGFTVKTNGTGSVKLSTKSAGTRAAYEFEHTETPADDGSWISKESLQSKTVVNGLTSGVRVYFRVRILLKGGFGDWSQTISIIIS